MMLNWYVARAAILASFSSILSGFIVGSVNGMLEMEGFQETFRFLYNGSNFNTSMNVCSSGNGAVIGVIVSISSVGGFFGALISGWLSDHISRKYTFAISGLLVFIGGILVAASFNLWTLIIGRFLLGFTLGIVFMVYPVYTSEIAPKENRGFLASTIGPTYNWGFFVAIAVNVGFEKFLLGWRVESAITALLGICYAIGVLFIPHTPRINRKSLSREEGVINTYLELEELKATITVSSDQTYSLLFKELLHYKHRLIIASTLFIVGGIGVFPYYYSTVIFSQVDVPAFYGSVTIGVGVVVGSIILTLIIDQFGRKSVLLVCTILYTITGLAIAILLNLKIDDDIAKYAIVALLCSNTFVYSTSWLTVPWVLGSEIFPTNVRGVCVSIGVAIYLLSTSIANQLIPIIVCFLGLHGFFYMVTGIYVSAFFFILFAMPETKGVSLEAMDKIFSQSVWVCFTRHIRCILGMDRADSLQEQEQQDKISQTHTVKSNLK